MRIERANTLENEFAWYFVADVPLLTGSRIRSMLVYTVNKHRRVDNRVRTDLAFLIVALSTVHLLNSG